MNKWLSDKVLLDTASDVYVGTFDVGKLVRVCAQAKEANRLRAGLENLMQNCELQKFTDCTPDSVAVFCAQSLRELLEGGG